MRAAIGDPLVRSAVLALRSWVPRPVFAALQRIDARLRQSNASVEARPPLAPDLRARLKREFAPEVLRLSELLGRDLTYWSQDQPSGPERSVLPVWLPQRPAEQPLSRTSIDRPTPSTQPAPAHLHHSAGGVQPPGPDPLLSVIILNYNGAPWLQRCLDSLRRQTLFDRSKSSWPTTPRPTVPRAWRPD